MPAGNGCFSKKTPLAFALRKRQVSDMLGSILHHILGHTLMRLYRFRLVCGSNLEPCSVLWAYFPWSNTNGWSLSRDRKIWNVPACFWFGLTWRARSNQTGPRSWFIQSLCKKAVNWWHRDKHWARHTNMWKARTWAWNMRCWCNLHKGQILRSRLQRYQEDADYFCWPYGLLRRVKLADPGWFRNGYLYTVGAKIWVLLMG